MPNDQPSGRKRYDQRLTEWFQETWDKTSKASKEELDELLASDDIEKLAAQAKQLADRLEGIAKDARTKKASKDAPEAPTEVEETSS
jgi:hypothetical protein